jgi:hypothetical protein
MTDDLQNEYMIERLRIAIERAEAAEDRIEELEAKLKTAEEIGRAFEEDAGQTREKLAKAVEALMDIVKDCEAEYPPSHGAIKYFCRTTLAELKGEDRG